MTSAADAPVATSRALPRGAAVHARAWGWRHAGRRAWALDGVDLDIAPGERVLVLGPSGAGKSTLLGGMAGLLGGDDEGEAHGDLLVDGLPPEQRRGRVGLVMQDPEAQVVLARLGDDVAFGCENLGVPREEIWGRVTDALRAVGLDLPLDHPTSKLSGGQKQRLALASVLAMGPGLLLLDEPTANLDPAGVAEVRAAAGEVLDRTGATLVVVEHRVDVWADLVDRAVVVLDGAVAADGPLDQILRDHGERLRAAGIWLPGDEEAVVREARAARAARSAVPEQLTPPVRSTPPAPGAGSPAPVCGQPALRGGSERTAAAPSSAVSPTASAGEGNTAPSSSIGNRAAEEAVLRGTALTIGYDASHPVLRGLDVAVAPGRSTCIVGRNGLGKSTLALTLAGLLPQLAGTVAVADDLAPAPGRTDPHRWRSRELLGRVSMVFQEPEYQFVARTVREELEIGPRLAGVAAVERAQLVDRFLGMLALERVALANPMTLSGGEKRRLSVATALISAPRVVILDEPTFGQDRTTWLELVGILRRAVDAGTTIVSITHDRAFVEVMGDEVIDLERLGLEGGRPEGRDRAAGEDGATAAPGAALGAGPGPAPGADPAPGAPSAPDADPAPAPAAAPDPLDRSRPDRPRPGLRDVLAGRGLRAVNPVTQFLGLAVMTTPLLATIDLLSAGIALALEVLLLPLTGIRPRQLLTRTAPLLVAAPLAAVSMLLYASPGGRVFWQFGPAVISENSVSLSLAILVRVLALGVPAIVLLSRIDPTDMADGLSQVLHLPARPVLASLAGIRMTGLMVADWKALERARRVRGLGDGNRVAAFFRGGFALLVFALRRSAKLSLTMEARGFGAPGPRTWARVSRVGAADAVMMAVCVVVPLLALAASLHWGTFQPMGR